MIYQFYANIKTYDNMPEQTNLLTEKNKNIFSTNDTFEIGDLKFILFTFHMILVIHVDLIYIIMKKKISIATDIGHMDNSILHKLRRKQFFIIRI